jgi:hypothetical protein
MENASLNKIALKRNLNYNRADRIHHVRTKGS